MEADGTDVCEACGAPATRTIGGNLAGMHCVVRVCQADHVEEAMCRHISVGWQRAAEEQARRDRHLAAANTIPLRVSDTVALLEAPGAVLGVLVSFEFDASADRWTALVRTGVGFGWTTLPLAALVRPEPEYPDATQNPGGVHVGDVVRLVRHPRPDIGRIVAWQAALDPATRRWQWSARLDNGRTELLARLRPSVAQAAVRRVRRAAAALHRATRTYYACQDRLRAAEEALAAFDSAAREEEEPASTPEA